MAGIRVNFTGNLVADPELRFTQSGKPVANFRVAVNSSRFDAKSGQWVDGDATFITCSTWGALAQNVVDGLKKGQRVMVEGTMEQRHYSAADGSNRSTYEVTAFEVGASLKYAKNGADEADAMAGNYPMPPAADQPPF